MGSNILKKIESIRSLKDQALDRILWRWRLVQAMYLSQDRSCNDRGEYTYYLIAYV